MRTLPPVWSETPVIRYSLRFAALAGLALGLFGLTLVPAPPLSSGEAAAAGPPRVRRLLSREEQIAAIERQIAELSKRLDDLKKAPVLDKTKPAGVEPSLPASWTSALHWRCIGPASMGGRIVALSVYEADPTTYWIATASGGLLKTTNNGVTFEHQFDREATVSIGDVCVAPSDKNIVWVGTGENNPRNSVSYGDGVYKSTDGGKSWKNMGLRKSFQIGRVVVHPKNPDIVYVGVLGRLYGPSEERGLYKSIDGGKTWNRILHVDDKTGVIEVKLHPSDPETMLVATWERQRDGFDSHAGAIAGAVRPNAKDAVADGYDAYDPIRKWGTGGGIWKSTNGGKTFARITKGLPAGAVGRIGLDYYRKDPKIVYAIVDCDKIGMGRVPGYLGVTIEERPEGVRFSGVTPDSPAAKAGLLAGDVVTAMDNKPIKKANDLSEIIGAHKPGDKISLAILRDKEKKTIEATLGERGAPLMARPRLDFKSDDTPNGVLVVAMLPQGFFARAGIQNGDLITAIDKKKVIKRGEIQDLVNASAQGGKLTFQVLRGKEKKELIIAMPQPPVQRRTTRPYAFWYGGQRENAQTQQGPDGFQYGGVFRSDDGGDTWVRVNSVNPRPMYFSQIRVDPSDDRHVYVLGIRLYHSQNGGKTFSMGGDAGVHPDHHALWIDPADGRHMLIGGDGGTYASYDRGGKWDYLNSAAIGQFYSCAVDSRRPYRVYGGMQDNGSWGGPSHTLDGNGPVNSDWTMVQGGDGFVCRIDPANPDIVYSESQEGNMVRTNLKTGEQFSIKPRAPAGQPPYRFNWNAPMIVSQHNPSTFYCGGNYVFRSVKRGDDPRRISPELTKNNAASATAVAESPRNADVLWAGTDDGALWVTRDGGANWTNVTSKVGLPKPYWVATIEPSRFVEGRCYVCFDAHRSDDDDPYVYVTEDFGATWKPIRGNLPTGSSRCLREDLYNADVLYLGTEFAVWASIDRGATWTKINNNLPTVAVHELAQHPSAGEMVAATHGRSLWVLDVTPLRQLKPATSKAPVTLLAPNKSVRWRRELPRGTVYGRGHREYFGENPQPGAHIYYSLTTSPQQLRLTIQDFAGKTVATLPVRSTPGLHKVTWNLRGPGTAIAADAFQPGRAMGSRNGFAAPGQYRVVLTVDGTDHVQGLRVENDPTLPPDRTITENDLPKKARQSFDH
jgi:photosystem II stability/assembly factor-like uncharacterized protein